MSPLMNESLLIAWCLPASPVSSSQKGKRFLSHPGHSWWTLKCNVTWTPWFMCASFGCHDTLQSRAMSLLPSRPSLHHLRQKRQNANKTWGNEWGTPISVNALPITFWQASNSSIASVVLRKQELKQNLQRSNLVSGVLQSPANP